MMDMSINSPQPSSFLDAFGEVKRAVWLVAWRAFAPLGMGPQQVRLMRLLGDGGAVTARTLSRATSADPSSVGRAIDGLVALGWVRRERGAVDRREVQLELTAAGKAMGRKLDRVFRKVEAAVTAPLSARDLADFKRIAGKFQALDEGDGVLPPDADDRPRGRAASAVV